MTLRFLAFLSILLLATPLATAQTTTTLSGSVSKTTIALGAGNTTSFDWTITVGGLAQGTVSVAAAAPAGWTVTVDPTSFGASAGAHVVKVLVTIPAERTAPNGTLTLTASVPNTGQGPSSTQQQVALQFVAPAPPPPPPPPPDYTWLIVGTIAGILVLAAGVYVFQARRVRLEIANPVARLNIGTGGFYKVTVENPTKAARNIQLRIRNLPPTWSAAFSFPSVPLNSKEVSEVPLWVNVPLAAAPNTKQGLRIQARPNRFSPWLVTRKLEVDTLDVVVPPTP